MPFEWALLSEVGGSTRMVDLFASGALAALIGSAAVTYAAFDFWETAPLIASVLVFGAASASAVSAATRRCLPTLAVAVCLVAT
jgi:hypothetical protein